MQRPLEADRVRQVPAVHAEALLAVVEAVRSQHLVQPEIGRGVGGGAAALVEPLSCVVHGLRRLSMPAGSDLLVVGAGTIGLLLMQAARRSGAAEVSVIDPDHSRRALAARMGADAVAASLDDLMGNQDPLIVAQEFWAMLCVYQGIRDLITYAAPPGVDPARVSFKRALNAAQDSTTRTALSPKG